MGYNLPPGVHESDLPGNRKEDRIYEHIFSRLPESIQDEIVEETEKGKWLDEKLQDLQGNLFTVDDLLSEMIHLDTDYEQIKKQEKRRKEMTLSENQTRTYGRLYSGLLSSLKKLGFGAIFLILIGCGVSDTDPDLPPGCEYVEVEYQSKTETIILCGGGGYEPKEEHKPR